MGTVNLSDFLTLLQVNHSLKLGVFLDHPLTLHQPLNWQITTNKKLLVLIGFINYII